MRRMLVVAAALLAMCVPALAQNDIDKGLDVSVGMFFLSDSAADEFAGNGIGVNIEKQISSRGDGDIYAGIGYIKMSETVDIWGFNVRSDISLIPIMLTLRHGTISEDADGGNAYYGAGVGTALTFTDVSDAMIGDEETTSKADFAWQLVGGMKLGRNVFAEAKYLNGGSDSNTGFSLAIGGRF